MTQDENSPMNKFKPFRGCLERSEGHLCLQHFNEPWRISKRAEKWTAVAESNSVAITWGWWMRMWRSLCREESSFLKQLCFVCVGERDILQRWHRWGLMKWSCATHQNYLTGPEQGADHLMFPTAARQMLRRRHVKHKLGEMCICWYYNVFPPGTSFLQSTIRLANETCVYLPMTNHKKRMQPKCAVRPAIRC